MVQNLSKISSPEERQDALLLKYSELVSKSDSIDCMHFSHSLLGMPASCVLKQVKLRVTGGHEVMVLQQQHVNTFNKMPARTMLFTLHSKPRDSWSTDSALYHTLITAGCPKELDSQRGTPN